MHQRGVGEEEGRKVKDQRKEDRHLQFYLLVVIIMKHIKLLNLSGLNFFSKNGGNDMVKFTEFFEAYIT
jgi:hypothetical protein